MIDPSGAGEPEAAGANVPRMLSSVLVALGVVWRVGFLGRDSFWLDEVFSVQTAARYSAADLWAGVADPLHPPLFYLILRAALQTAGVSEAAARLASASASVRAARNTKVRASGGADTLSADTLSTEAHP